MDNPESKRDFVESFKQLLDDPTHSDLVIKCGDKQWHVHKVIVCARSTWFAAALKHPMKETKDNLIELKEIEQPVVEAMLQWIYTTDYNYPEPPTNSMLFNVHVHIVADQFDLPGLEKLAASKFEQTALQDWSTPAFASAVDTVYNEAVDRNRLLRASILDVASKHAAVLYGDKTYVEFQAVASSNLAFVSELAARLATNPVSKDENRKKSRSSKPFF